jgi:hypothetical protein
LNGPVRQGEVLVVLYSPRATIFNSLAIMISKELEIVERPYLDGRMTEKGQITAHGVVIAQNGQEATELDADITANKWRAGLVQRWDLDIANAENVDQKINLANAQYSQKIFDLQAADQHDRIKQARKFIDAQKRILADFLSRLTLKAPRAGTFTAAVAEGSFLKQGQKIGELK